MFKKWICFIMVFLLVPNFSACRDKKSTTEKEVPNYAEKEIGSNSNIKAPNSSRLNVKGQLVVYERGSDSLQYKILDSESNPVGEIKSSVKGDGSVFALDSSDRLYAAVKNMMSGTKVEYQLYILNEKGETEKNIDLKDVLTSGETEAVYEITDIAVDSKGKIYLADARKNIQVLDKDGKLVKTIPMEGCCGICMDEEDNILVTTFIGSERKSLEKVNTSTGQVVWKRDFPENLDISDFQSQKKIGYVKSDKSIYLVDDKGVKMYDSQGKPAGSVLDFASTGIYASGFIVADFDVDAAKNIYIVTTEMMYGSDKDDIKYEIYRYTIQAAKEGSMKNKTITVTFNGSERFFQMAASRFQRANPGYKIILKNWPYEDREKYQNNLNTEILSGKGPDIISIARLPYEKYISKNILLDLAPYIENNKSTDMSQYYANIIEGMKVNGKLYSIPIDFSFGGLIANKKILDELSILIDDSRWTWNDFMEICERVTDPKSGRIALPDSSYSSLMEMITTNNYGKFVDMKTKKSNFKSAEFMNLLNFVKANGDDKLENNRDAAKEKLLYSDSMEAALQGKLVFLPTAFRCYANFSEMKGQFKDEIILLNYPTDGNGSGEEYQCDYAFGINNSSTNKEEAWEFIKLLMSDEMQTSENAPCFRISKAGNLKLEEEIKKLNEERSKTSPETFFGGKYTYTTQEDIAYVDRFIGKLKKHTRADETIANIVKEESKAFFSGSKTAEEVAAVIENKVNTYIGE